MTSLRSTSAPGRRAILGLGALPPRGSVTNDELRQTMDTSDEWIRTRVGIAERRWSPGRTRRVVDMAVAAGRQGAGRRRAVRRRHRPGDRRHLHQPGADPGQRRRRWPTGSASPRPAPST